MVLTKTSRLNGMVKYGAFEQVGQPRNVPRDFDIRGGFREKCSAPITSQHSLSCGPNDSMDKIKNKEIHLKDN